MIAGTEKQLWTVTENLRSSVPFGEYARALSQLFVLSELARRETNFKATIETAIAKGNARIKDLLQDALELLEGQGFDETRQLITVEDTFWSALSAEWTFNTVDQLSHDTTSSEERAQWLTHHAAPFSNDPIGVPDEILFTMREFLRDANSVYLPFDSSALAFLEVTRNNQSINLRPHSPHGYQLVSRVLFLANRDAHLERVSPRSFENPPVTSSCIIIPPFGHRLDPKIRFKLPQILGGAGRLTAEEIAVSTTVIDLKGPTVALVPSGIMFRSGSSRHFREWLVEQIGLFAVIEFPPRVLGNSSIGCVILLIDPTLKNTNSVRLVVADSEEFLEEQRAGRFRVAKWKDLVAVVQGDSDSEFSVDVQKRSIRENDYVLNPARYLSQERNYLQLFLKHRPIAQLSSVAEIRRPIPIKDSHLEQGTIFHEVLISDFGIDGLIYDGSKVRKLDEFTLAKTSRQALRPGDILLGVRGTIGKVAMVAEDADENLLAGQSTVILRLSESGPITSPVYLLRYLAQPQVIAYLESLAGGSAISFIRVKDLANLSVPIPTEGEQQRILAVHNEILSSIAESKRLARKAASLSENAFGQETLENI